MSVSTLLFLGLAALGASVMDTIAGGGGLITLPALLAAGLPPLSALATNKGQSVWGSTTALARFSRTDLLDRKRAPWAFPCGFFGSLAGVLLLRSVPSDVLQPLVLGLLLGAAFMVLAVRPRPRGVERQRGLRWTLIVAGAIGMYDGFFGPGTGTLLILADVLFWRHPYDRASANAKVVNCASNWGALMVFACAGDVQWRVALVMAAGQVAGGIVGTHLVVRRGQRLVRAAAVVISLALAARVAWQLAMRP